jgi:hypothetical protein
MKNTRTHEKEKKKASGRGNKRENEIKDWIGRTRVRKTENTKKIKIKWERYRDTK